MRKMAIRESCVPGLAMTMLLLIAWGQPKAQDRQMQADTGVTLRIGDSAPPIVVHEWVKGGPVSGFQPGMVYVVEFWATWCGACQDAMPHLSELARKYKGKVEVLSFDVREDKKTDYLPKVERFVKWSGRRMDYNVAVDAMGNVMYNTWLQASGSRGIPELFVVDQEGRIAWCGHPNHVDDVLEAVVNGQYDEANREKIEEATREKSKRYDSLGTVMMRAQKKGDYTKALANLVVIFPLFPALNMYLTELKYEFLSHVDSIKARQLGDSLVTQWYPKDLLAIAVLIMYSGSGTAFVPDYGLAYKMAERGAAQSDPEDRAAYSILAEVSYKAGYREKAIENQEKVIQLLKNDSTASPKVLEWAEKALKQYTSPRQ
jgi:thiol-disulfide isomerase/thioredoxin